MTDYADDERWISTVAALPLEEGLRGIDEDAPADLRPVARAEVLRLAAQLVEARDAYRRALVQDGTSPIARAGLAFLEQRGDERISTLKRIVAEQPELGTPRYYLAVALSSMREYRRGVDQAREAVARLPADPRPLAVVSNLLLRLRDPRNAAAAALELAAAAPRSPSFQVMAAQLLFRARAVRDAYRVPIAAARRRTGGRSALLPFVLPLVALEARNLVAFAVASFGVSISIAWLILVIAGNWHGRLFWVWPVPYGPSLCATRRRSM